MNIVVYAAELLIVISKVYGGVLLFTYKLLVAFRRLFCL